MTTNDDWGGRRFGDLTPREQRDAARKAFRQLQQEFEEHADEISAVLDINPAGDTVTHRIALTREDE